MARLGFAPLILAFALAACGGRPTDIVTPPDTTPVDTTHPPASVAMVVVSPTYHSTLAGSTVQLTAVAKDSMGNTLPGRAMAWLTSDAVVATVNGAGVVTARAPGVAIIRASSEGKAAEAAVSVPIPSNTAAIQHVLVLVEENTEYTNVIGSSAMPYLNALASQYGLATQSYGSTHPSLPNYFAMTVGTTVAANNSYVDTVRIDNVVRRLLAAGKTWKSYAEHLPSVGYTGGDVDPYVKHHNPFTYIGDVIDDAVQRQKLVPFTQFAQDLTNGTLPNYAMIVPNVCSDGHNCSLSLVDDWLSTNIGPLLRNPQFQQSGLLIITFDEGTSSTNGGGRIATVVIGPRARRGFQSTTTYQHPSLLRLTLESLGLASFPNGSATAPSMMEFLTP